MCYLLCLSFMGIRIHVREEDKNESILNPNNLLQFELQLLEYGPSRAALEDAATKVENLSDILELLKGDDAPTAQIAEAHAKIAASNLKELLKGGTLSKFDYSSSFSL